MMKATRFPISVVTLFMALFVLTGCQTLREFAALRNVTFNLDRLSEVRLAGIDIQHVRSYSDLRVTDVLNLTQAVARKELPLVFTLHVNAENPQENSVAARLFKLDWTLLLDDTETISGVMDTELELPPGQPQTFPVNIQLDLVQFFDRNARDLFELAQALGGQQGVSTRVQLRATPTISTAIGPIRYPQPITIVSQSVGS